MGEKYFYPNGDGYYLDLKSLVFIVLVLKYDTCLVPNTSANYVSYVLGILIGVSVLTTNFIEFTSKTHFELKNNI